MYHTVIMLMPVFTSYSNILMFTIWPHLQFVNSAVKLELIFSGNQKVSPVILILFILF